MTDVRNRPPTQSELRGEVLRNVEPPQTSTDREILFLVYGSMLAAGEEANTHIAKMVRSHLFGDGPKFLLDDSILKPSIGPRE